MSDTKTLPWTVRRLHDPEYVAALYDRFITFSMVPSRATDYSRSVCRGEVPDLPDDVDPDAELDFEAAAAYTGFHSMSPRQVWANYGLSNSPMSRSALPPIRDRA